MSQLSQSVSELPALYSTLGDDPDLSGLVELFVEEMPERIDALTRTFKDRQIEELGCIAHQLKGAAGSYGFDQITPLAAKLEADARGDASWETITESLETLVDTCSRLRAGSPSS